VFRDKMKVHISKAHWELYKRLQLMGYNVEIERGILLTNSDITVHHVKNPFDQRSSMHDFFVDGYPHTKPKAQDWDNLVDQVLRHKKIPFDRLPYKRYSKRLIDGWVKIIEGVVGAP